MAETRQPLSPQDEIESMADSFFQKVYSGEQSIDEVGVCGRWGSLD